MNSVEPVPRLDSARLQRRSAPPSTRVRSFTSISERINALSADYDIMKEAVEGLLSVLDVPAGLMMITAPSAQIYSKHIQRSESLVDFERTLKSRSQNVFSAFAFEPSTRLHHVDGLLLIPLKWQSTITGLLAFEDKSRLVASRNEDSLLLISNQLAAIFGQHRSQVPGTRSRDVGLKADEINQAVAIQQSLLPAIPSPTHGLSIATHTQAAGFVGGDYFDLIVVDKNKIGIVIADVEGKGVAAALFGNLLRTTVHFLTRESPSTAAVVAKINSILHKEASSAHKLFTLFYAVFDADTKLLSYTGSGHVSPIIVRTKSREVERLYSEGIPVGIQHHQRLHERSIQLNRGDLLAFFTDGLTECTNEGGDLFGDDRLADLLRAYADEPAENILAKVFSDVTGFLSGSPIDDMTLILTKVV